MNIGELDIHDWIKRIQNIENIDINERLHNIEKQFRFFSMICQELDMSFKKGIELSIIKKDINIDALIEKFTVKLKDELNLIHDLRVDLQNQIKEQPVIDTLRFIGKSIHEMNMKIDALKENGIKKDIHLAFSVDGYEMTKKRHIESINNDKSPEDEMDFIIKSFSEKEALVLIHRYGLKGEKPKTYKKIGDIIKLTGVQVSNIHRKILMKLKKEPRRQMFKKITNKKLRDDVFWKDKK